MCVYIFENNACIRKKPSFARVAHLLLLRSVISYSGREYACVQALRVDRKCRVIHKKSTCVCLHRSSSCRELLGNAGTQSQPVAGLRPNCLTLYFFTLFHRSLRILMRSLPVTSNQWLRSLETSPATNTTRTSTGGRESWRKNYCWKRRGKDRLSKCK